MFALLCDDALLKNDFFASPDSTAAECTRVTLSVPRDDGADCSREIGSIRTSCTVELHTVGSVKEYRWAAVGASSAPAQWQMTLGRTIRGAQPSPAQHNTDGRMRTVKDGCFESQCVSCSQREKTRVGRSALHNGCTVTESTQLWTGPHVCDRHGTAQRCCAVRCTAAVAHTLGKELPVVSYGTKCCHRANTKCENTRAERRKDSFKRSAT